MAKAWAGFAPGRWFETIDMRDFIQKNYAPYYGDESFLAEPPAASASLWNQANELIQDEVRNKTIKVDLERFSGIDNFPPGYLDRDQEVIVGLQTHEPLKRTMDPYGGFRMLRSALDADGLKMDPIQEDSQPGRL